MTAGTKHESSDLVRDAFLTTSNDNIDLLDLNTTEKEAARASTVTGVTSASIDARLELIETVNATLAAASGTTVSLNDATTGNLYGTDGTDGKLRVSGHLSMTEGNDGGAEYLTLTNPINIMTWF